MGSRGIPSRMLGAHWCSTSLSHCMQDENRFASKGAHINLKRAERARAAINKLPGMLN